jgi:hypothetical protein
MSAGPSTVTPPLGREHHPLGHQQRALVEAPSSRCGEIGHVEDGERRIDEHGTARYASVTVAPGSGGLRNSSTTPSGQPIIPISDGGDRATNACGRSMRRRAGRHDAVQLDKPMTCPAISAPIPSWVVMKYSPKLESARA